eukprot:gb/GECG01010148.1/.p1 GENE.gb/GECG01010148.1/~~gb/GECG01010148.1/.p1  ORF type:complete len:138 (+),score=18.05 gb/GECG01010148.1/:1-414(+)
MRRHTGEGSLRQCSIMVFRYIPGGGTHETSLSKLVHIDTLSQGGKQSSENDYLSTNSGRFFYFDEFMGLVKRSLKMETLPRYVVLATASEALFADHPLQFFDREGKDKLCIEAKTLVAAKSRKWWKNSKLVDLHQNS